MKIGIDIDGVLADFVTGYSNLIRSETGVKFPLDAATYPTVWDWVPAQLRDEGYSENYIKETEARAWGKITAQGSAFWGTLPAYDGAVDTLYRLSQRIRHGDEIYFITNRPGHMVKWQTEMWLITHGAKSPTVLIASKKGLVSAGLELDVFVEDKPENITDVLLNTQKPLKAYLIDRPYNRGGDFGNGKVFNQRTGEEVKVSVARVRSLMDVLDIEFPEQQELQEAA